MIERARQPHKLILECISAITAPKITVMGEENLTKAEELIKQNKLLIFTPNHLSNADAPALLRALKKEGFGKMSGKIVFLQGIKLDNDPTARFLMRGTQRIRVWPTSLPANTDEEKQERLRMTKDSWKAAKNALVAGDHLLIFPEGGRSYMGQLKEGEPAIAHFLKLSPETWVLPVGIAGTEKVLPPNKKFPVPHPISIRFGPPTNVNNLIQATNHLPPKERNKAIVGLVMKVIAGCLPEQYRGVYA